MSFKSSFIFRLPEQQDRLASRFQTHKRLFGRDVLQGVWAIFDEVAERGDAGIRRLTQAFDRVELEDLELTEAYVEACIASLSPALRGAVDQAIRNVREANEAMKPESWTAEIRPGTVIGETVRPLDSVGIWIPARKGPLLSTAIMLVTAAKVAGVPHIVVGMPPRPDGLGDPGTVAAARLAGADRIVVGNGVAVIAAFAQGTAAIPETDGILGPGPGGIAAAMSVAMTYGKKSALGIGPTECMIVADETADPERLAYDLINEAEHGPDSSAILATASSELAEAVGDRLKRLIEEAEPVRRDFLRHVFGPEGKGALVVAPDLERACAFANDFAPEHLMVVCSADNERLVLEQVRHAGEILVGGSTPFSAANYAIGITAVLPTNRFARAFSGVTCREMMKVSTVGRLTPPALAELLPVIRELGTYEGLPGHVRAAEVRGSGIV